MVQIAIYEMPQGKRGKDYDSSRLRALPHIVVSLESIIVPDGTKQIITCSNIDKRKHPALTRPSKRQHQQLSSDQALTSGTTASTSSFKSSSSLSLSFKAAFSSLCHISSISISVSSTKSVGMIRLRIMAQILPMK
jgi:hypothetical protein